MLTYGIGIALLLSLAYNGFLLAAQGGQAGPAIYPTVAILSASAGEQPDLQGQLQACSQENKYKDSLIHILEQVTIDPPTQPLAQKGLQ